MGIRSSIYIIGVLLAALGLGMLLSAVVAMLYAEEDLFALLLSGVVTITFGLVMFFAAGFSGKPNEVSHRSAFAIVTFGWIAACVLGSLPYYFYAVMPNYLYEDAPKIAAGEDVDTVLVAPADCKNDTGLGREFCSFTNCVFESSSGFTTTGATILEAGLWKSPSSRKGGLPHGLLFWRALTHFLGGMGIIVFGVAILPLLGVGGMQLFKAEVPGPVKDKRAPRVAETARLLWKVYAGLTGIEFLLLLSTGQGAFLALTHSFATMATGGFSPLASSIETLNSPFTEWVIIIFMALAGMNFALHFNSIRRRRLIHWRDYELRFYLTVTFVVTLILAYKLFTLQELGVHESIRTSAFQTLSILTTTGFSSRDFGQWAVGAQILLFILFFIGGSSGSTGGGVKCVRIFLMLRLAIDEMKRLVHPHGVIQTKLSKSVVPVGVINSVAGFIVLYLSLYMVSVIIFSVSGYDFETSLTVVGATLGNIGPGLGDVGPAANYNFFNVPEKVLQIFLMIVGRLEIYSVLILLTPEFWRR